MPDNSLYEWSEFVRAHQVGKSHLAIALGVAAVRGRRSVYFTTLAELIATLSKAEREGNLASRLRYINRVALLIVDEVGYLPIDKGGTNLFFPSRQHAL